MSADNPPLSFNISPQGIKLKPLLIRKKWVFISFCFKGSFDPRDSELHTFFEATLTLYWWSVTAAKNKHSGSECLRQQCCCVSSSVRGRVSGPGLSWFGPADQDLKSVGRFIDYFNNRFILQEDMFLWLLPLFVTHWGKLKCIFQFLTSCLKEINRQWT